MRKSNRSSPRELWRRICRMQFSFELYAIVLQLSQTISQDDGMTPHAHFACALLLTAPLI
jgi:hypothetical protein